jgi:hypothetical protein
MGRVAVARSAPQSALRRLQDAAVEGHRRSAVAHLQPTINSNPSDCAACVKASASVKPPHLSSLMFTA